MFVFHSQQGEDIFLLQNFINQPVIDGFYVEIGALDGIRYSNSYFFEKYFGFRGMLVEAQDHMFRSLKSYRPNNILINKAISTSSNPVEFIGHDPCGGIKDTMPHKHMQVWHKNAKTYQVETDRFDKLFDFHNINYVDFMVIDVEGGELDVLYTIDFSKVQIYVICIELDGQNVIKDNHCRKLLSNHGFTFYQKLCGNEFWVNEEYERKDRLFDKSLKKQFSGIDKRRRHSNCGFHHDVELHLIDEINNVLK